MPARYISPFTDFGFKKLFGNEQNKDLLIDFLNQVIPDEGLITDLRFLKTEHLGATQVDRKAVFDLYCQTATGQRFIVELQKVRQKYYLDRSLFYAAFAIQEQGQRGDEWDFRLDKVYTISILDFVLDEYAAWPDKLRHDVRLIETETGRVFNDKLRFVYLEMPKFRKTVDELESNYDKWLFALRNLARLDEVPDRLRNRLFEKLFQMAEIAGYDERERQAYEESLKIARDMKNSLDYAEEKGRTEGREEGWAEGRAEGREESREEIVRAAIRAGLSDELIGSISGLSQPEIQDLRATISDSPSAPAA